MIECRSAGQVIGQTGQATGRVVIIEWRLSPLLREDNPLIAVTQNTSSSTKQRRFFSALLVYLRLITVVLFYAFVRSLVTSPTIAHKVLFAYPVSVCLFVYVTITILVMS